MMIKQHFIKLALSVICTVGMYHSASAAVMNINPPLSSVSAGNIVTATVNINTEGLAINSAEAQIIFPADVLEVVSIDKSGSIFSLWVEGPTFSNTSGTIGFSGGVPSPGFSGSAGKVLSVVFKAKRAGNASLVFANSNVMANDGSGTNVAKTSPQAVVNISPASQNIELVSKVDTTVKLPPLPVVTSSTHPDENVWYSSDKIRMDWDVPKGILEVQTLLSKYADVKPTISHDGTFSAITVNDLKDGVLYFHMRYRNAGGWGPTLHRKIKIDTQVPSDFTLQVTDDGLYSYLHIDAKDTLSGIAKFELHIDGNKKTDILPENLVDGVYRLPVMEGGVHNLLLEVYDAAGNEKTKEIKYNSPAIVPPKIVGVPQTVIMNQSIVIEGESMYHDTRVNVFIQTEGGDIKALKTSTDSNGKFRLVINDTVECELAACVVDNSGATAIWTQLMFDDGVLSPTSDKKNIIIENTSWMKIVYGSTKALSLTVPLLAVVFVLIILVYIGWHRFFGLKRKIHKDTREVVQDIHRAMSLYKDELSNQLDELEKVKEDRDLNRKEEKIFKELSDNINNIERFIERKLKKY